MLASLWVAERLKIATGIKQRYQPQTMKGSEQNPVVHQQVTIYFPKFVLWSSVLWSFVRVYSLVTVDDVFSFPTKSQFFPTNFPDPPTLSQTHTFFFPDPLIFFWQIFSANVLYSETFAALRTQSRRSHGSGTSPPPPKYPLPALPSRHPPSASLAVSSSDLRCCPATLYSL